MPHATCRTKNLVQDAVVEAALKIDKKLGREMALTLLREEGVPDEVAARIFGQEPALRRSRQTAPEGLRAQSA